MKLNKKYLLIVIAFIVLSSSISINSSIWWDEAVYVGIGKCMFSFGESGFIEESRPLVLPLILGMFWKLGFDVLLIGKVFSILFSVGVVLLTYLIGKRLSNERIALAAAFFTAFFPSFLFFSPKILTGIISVFFMLLAVCFFINNRFLLSGIFCAISFNTRFLQLFGFLVLLFLILYDVFKKKKKNKDLKKFLLGFVVVLIPFLLLYQILIGNFIKPFLLQISLTKETGWMYFEPWWFYIAGIFKENLFLVLLPITLLFLINKSGNIKKKKFFNLILMLFVVFFLFFSLIKHKEMRFVITFLPYVALMSAYAFFIMVDKIKEIKVRYSVFIILFLILIFQFMFNVIPFFETKPDDKNNVFQEYFEEIGKEEKIWISDPKYSLYSDAGIDELIYYPTFDKEKFNFLIQNYLNADVIMINTCDIPCPPSYDNCEEDKFNLLNEFKENFKLVYSDFFDGCEGFVFSN